MKKKTIKATFSNDLFAFVEEFLRDYPESVLRNAIDRIGEIATTRTEAVAAILAGTIGALRDVLLFSLYESGDLNQMDRDDLKIVEIYACLFAVDSKWNATGLIPVLRSHLKHRKKGKDLANIQREIPLTQDEQAKLLKQDFWSTKDVARFFGVSRRQVQRWAKERQLKRSKIGQFKCRDVMNFLEKSKYRWKTMDFSKMVGKQKGRS